jgi:hypothetical protein
MKGATSHSIPRWDLYSFLIPTSVLSPSMVAVTCILLWNITKYVICNSVTFTDLDCSFHKTGTIGNNEVWIRKLEIIFKVSIIHAKADISANPNILAIAWRGWTNSRKPARIITTESVSDVTPSSGRARIPAWKSDNVPGTRTSA